MKGFKDKFSSIFDKEMQRGLNASLWYWRPKHCRLREFSQESLGSILLPYVVVKLHAILTHNDLHRHGYLLLAGDSMTEQIYEELRCLLNGRDDSYHPIPGEYYKNVTVGHVVLFMPCCTSTHRA
jgi:hypothetical protein